MGAANSSVPTMTLVNRHGHCASVLGYSVAVDASIVEADCHTSNTNPTKRNQEWKVITLPAQGAKAQGLCLLMASNDGCASAANNKCLVRNQKKSGSNVLLGECS